MRFILVCRSVCLCVYADMMVNMGYSQKEVEDSLLQQKYNDIMATYLLLARRASDVSRLALFALDIS